MAPTYVQMASLTSDIVLLVNTTVQTPDGPVQVLAPQVYLTAADARDLSQTGSLTAANAINITATGVIDNTGTIQAATTAQLAAGTLLNGGNVAAGQTARAEGHSKSAAVRYCSAGVAPRQLFGTVSVRPSPIVNKGTLPKMKSPRNFLVALFIACFGSLPHDAAAEVQSAEQLPAVDTSHGLPFGSVGPSKENIERFWKGKKNSDGPLPIGVPSGRWVNVYQYFNVDELCRPMRFSIKVIEFPQHGEISVRDSQYYLSVGVKKAFSSVVGGVLDSRKKCPTDNLPSPLIIYQPSPGFVGEDRATIEVSDHGFITDEHFRFNVYKKGAAQAPSH